jgi:Ser/Thr protein kinase RdoA (MazF antagonist)
MHLLQVVRHTAPATQVILLTSPTMLDVESMLPPTELAVVERFRDLMAHLRTLPKGPESYGLIHQDFHAGNFLVDDDGQFTLFDFDDCVYGWYAYDVALVLFYAALWADDPQAFTRQFMTHFLRGYLREYPFDSVWLHEIPHFLKLREIDLYAIIHRSFDVENLEDPFSIHYMDGRRERIELGVPTIDFDFLSLKGDVDGAE